MKVGLNLATLTTFVTGLLFSIGLCLSGMTQPSKVVGFLDISGNWDPSLGLVMFGAVTTYFIGTRFILRRKKPVLAEKYGLPTGVEIDGRLLAGSSMFGVGWGLAGFCPGPALASLVTFDPNIIVFVLAMTVGMYVYGTLDTRFTSQPDGGAGIFEALKAARATAKTSKK